VNQRLRVLIADDERPARSFLAALIRSFEDVTIVGEADTLKDPKYVDLVSMVDSFPDNPGEKLGSLVEGRVGKARWIYLDSHSGASFPPAPTARTSLWPT
jgi:DNA-binding NarL/FixJ family response regulator